MLARVIVLCKESRHFTLTVWKIVTEQCDKIQEVTCEGLGNHARLETILLVTNHATETRIRYGHGGVAT